MLTNAAIKTLKDNIQKNYDETKQQLRDNVYRGHLRSISADVENFIGAFISDICNKNYKIFIDSSIRIGEKTHRPDILIVNNNKVVALIEIKTHMGYCRDASSIVKNEILEKHKIFTETNNLTCKFNIYDQQKNKIEKVEKIYYDNTVKLFLVSCTSANCGETWHNSNKKCANSNGIDYLVLFNNWYNNLEDREICNFAQKLSVL